MDFDEINKELSYDNAVCYKKGDNGEYRGEKFKFSEDIWQMKTEVEDKDLIKTLRQIIVDLYNKKSFLQTLSSKCDFSIWITIYSESVQSNYRFDNDVLSKIAEIGATLDLSVMNLEAFFHCQEDGADI